jgi:hypothetical protein
MFKKLLAVGFILAVGAASAMAAGLDTGYVKDNNGIPVAGATVTYTRAPNAWTATTDSNGIYRFNLGGTQSLTIIGSAAGAGTLVASKIGYVNSAAGTFICTPADTITPSVVGNLTLNIAIKTTTGTVVDSFNSVVIAGAKVLHKRLAVTLDSTVTLANGTYTLSLVNLGDSVIVSAPLYFTKKAVDPITAAQTTNVINITLSAFGSVSGVVTNDSATGAPIKSATVSLSRVVNGVAQTPFAITTTDSTGHYLLDSIFSHVPYQVSAVAVTFLSQAKTIPSKAVGPDAVNFTLSPATAGIMGTVTTDSANGMIAKGAKIVLTKGVSTVHVDSTVTDSLGHYAFANDSVNLSYTVTASLNGYQTTPVTFTKTVFTDVENIVLQPGANKTFWVKVLGTASAPLANASVGFAKGNAVIGGTTSALGVFQVTNAPAGFDTITITDTNYLSQQFLLTLSAHSPDTMTYTLTQVAAGTVQRAIRGTAHKLTATGAVASGATIVFKCVGGYVFAATTTSVAPLGTWSVVGIPAAIPAAASIAVYSAATGNGLIATLPPSVTATRDTVWNTFTNPAAIAIAAAGLTTYNTVVFTVGNVTVGVLPTVADKAPEAPAFSVLHSGIITMKSMVLPGVVKVFNLQGQLLYNHAFEANTVSLHVPALAQGKSAFIVSITQNDKEFKQVVMMP